MMKGDDDCVVVFEVQFGKLVWINLLLMGWVEWLIDLCGNVFLVFEIVILLEGKVCECIVDFECVLGDFVLINVELVLVKDVVDCVWWWLGDVIEMINEGFVIFDFDDWLVLCNQIYLLLWFKVVDQIVFGVCFDEIFGKISEMCGMFGVMVVFDCWVLEWLLLYQIGNGGQVIVFVDGCWIQVNECCIIEGGVVGVYIDIIDIKVEDVWLCVCELVECVVVLQVMFDVMLQGVCVFDCDCLLLVWNDLLFVFFKLQLIGVKLKIVDYDVLVDWCCIVLFCVNVVNMFGWFGEGEVEIVVVCVLLDGCSVEVCCLLMFGGGMVMSFDDVIDWLCVVVVLCESNEMFECWVEECIVELQ